MARYSTSPHEFGMRTRRALPFTRYQTRKGDRPFVPKLFALIWLTITASAVPAFVNAVSIRPSTDYLSLVQPFAMPLTYGFGAITLGIMLLGAVRRFLISWRFGAFISALGASLTFGCIGALSMHSIMHYTVPMVSLLVQSAPGQQIENLSSVKTIPACNTSDRRARQKTNCVIRKLFGTNTLRYKYNFSDPLPGFTPPVYTFAAPNGLSVLKNDTRLKYTAPKPAVLTGPANWFGMQVDTVNAG